MRPDAHHRRTDEAVPAEFVGAIDARLTGPGTISPSLVGAKVKGLGSHEVV